MGDRVARSIVLAARPDGRVKESDFRFETSPVPEPGENEMLLETQYLSLDPYMRARMDAVKSYAAYLEIGDVMVGQASLGWLSRIIRNFGPATSFSLRPGGARSLCRKARTFASWTRSLVPPTSWLGILGTAGFAAYVGMRVIGRPAPRETVVVAAASGGVGALVGQLARRAGARAVGIAGGPDKCSYIKEAFGFEEAIDHRAPDLDKRLKDACPNGVDVYFENVGGDVFTAVWPLLNQFARIPICGLVGQFGRPTPPGPDRLPGSMRQVLSKKSHHPRLRHIELSGTPCGFRKGDRQRIERWHHPPARRYHQRIRRNCSRIHANARRQQLRKVCRQGRGLSGPRRRRISHGDRGPLAQEPASGRRGHAITCGRSAA